LSGVFSKDQRVGARDDSIFGPMLGLWASIVALPIILQATVLLLGKLWNFERPVGRDDAYTTLKLSKISSFLISGRSQLILDA
jgi:hypothetical protein